jgi:hypothetical protein
MYAEVAFDAATLRLRPYLRITTAAVLLPFQLFNHAGALVNVRPCVAQNVAEAWW